RLYIGESAVCNAKITGTDVLVKGTVNGDIAASSRLTLKKPARVTGNIATANLTIEEGVFFEGKCIMGSGSSLGSDRKTETTK
ncbi:MAG: polymer-forming cytoskeletal protein, partial [Bdellovibrionales bacterium]|nr:polymer-forming cytoskeletal protein [Bdellovibrionales bacterium]